MFISKTLQFNSLYKLISIFNPQKCLLQFFTGYINSFGILKEKREAFGVILQGEKLGKDNKSKPLI